MCGIIGIVAKDEVNQAIYDGLTVLQHRGQDAAGIMTCDGNHLFLRKKKGLVRDVFRSRHMVELKGNIGIGHVRYPTAGCDSSAEAQPFFVNSPYGIALGHNGNLINVDQLKDELFREGLRHINTQSDSEVLLNVFAHELQRAGKLKISDNDIFDALARVAHRCRGAYAAVAMIMGYGIVAFRDEYGIRPLVYGQRETAKGVEYMVASESVALDLLGFKLVRDVLPGEAIFISLDGKLSSRQFVPPKMRAPCLFEYVYLARPDSIIDNISVYKARLRMGEALADKILHQRPDHDIDVVIPIPDTSRTAALPLAYKLGVKYREGFIKNRYIGRTFIMPGQKQRQHSVKQKLNAIGLEFKGKNVLLVDDSIVRGTTSKKIIEMAREAGANKVYFASAAPPVRYPNVYGIDMPVASEFIAHGRSEEQIREYLNADWLIYQDLEDLEKAVHSKKKDNVDRFEASCFDGHYICGDVSESYLEDLESRRSDGAKKKRSSKVTRIDFYNAS